jgi:uncharacterized protein
MADMALTTRRLAGRIDWTLVVVLAGFVALALADAGQARDSAIFVGEALLGVAPFLFASIAIAAYAKASGADSLIARAFEGREVTMIGAAALMGALSPFCSCGVIPLIAALLSMGVPLAPVMAFWLASPLMDPSMFFLTAGTLGMDFALFKVFAAVAVGLMGGFGTFAVVRAGGFENPLREGVGNGGCGASSIRAPKQVVWKFWNEQGRREKFAKNARETTLFLGKWLAVAFFLESLMLAYVPAETVTSVIGGEGWLPVLGATLVGVPAYLNGYAALPLVGGLIEQGMAPGAGMAFLLAGGVSSIPAMIAVWALARPHVFAVYLGFAFVGAFSMGALYGVIA